MWRIRGRRAYSPPSSLWMVRATFPFCRWFSSTCSPPSTHKAPDNSLPDTPAPNNEIHFTSSHTVFRRHLCPRPAHGHPGAQSSSSSRSSSSPSPLFSLSLSALFLQASGCVSPSCDDCNINNGYYLPARDWLRFTNAWFTQEPLTNDCCAVNTVTNLASCLERKITRGGLNPH